MERVPFPDVRGKRCLDIGTFDGFFAFEMERRGAAEVVATDISDHANWDWPPDMRSQGPGAAGPGEIAGGTREGFSASSSPSSSSAPRPELRRVLNDLRAQPRAPRQLRRRGLAAGLLLHLRDPLRALEAVRSVCGGVFFSGEEIRLGLSLLNRNRAVAELNGSGGLCQWWVPTAAGHERMVFAAGFEILERSKPYCIGWPGAPRPREAPTRDRPARAAPRGLRNRRRAAVGRARPAACVGRRPPLLWPRSSSGGQCGALAVGERGLVSEQEGEPARWGPIVAACERKSSPRRLSLRTQGKQLARRLTHLPR